MGKQLVTKIRGMNPLAKKGALLLLAFLVSFACISGPKSAEAAVTALTGNAWRTTASTTAISATAYFRGTTAAPGATNTYAIAAGANRLLVVVLAINTSAAQNVRIPTVKYGLAGSENQTLSVATTDQATSSRQHTWIFYLNEAGIAAANGTNLSFTYTGTVPTYTGTYANAAVYTGVDQTTPILTPTTYNSGATANTTVGPLGTSQVVVAGNLALQMMNTLRTGSSTAATITYDATPAAWTAANATTRTGTTPAAYAANFAVRTIATAGTHDSTHTSSASVLDSMSAMTLKAGGVTVANGSTVVAPSPGVYAGDVNVTVDAFTLGGSGNVTGITVTGNANATSTNVSGFKIWKKVGADPTKYEAADQQIGSGVPNGTTPVAVTLTVPQTISANTNYVITYDIASTAVANGTSVTVSGAVSALTPAAVTVTDTATAATILATTTVGNGASEPANARLWKSSAATLIDTFTLKNNGAVTTDDDPVTTVTVTMTPAYISGGSGGTITKFKLMEVISCTDYPVCAVPNTTTYGTAASATLGDVWNVPTTGLTAKSVSATYYIRVTTADVITPSPADPSGTLTGIYTPITATVTAIAHSRGNNKVVVSDTTSASLTIDMEKPNGPATATASTGSGYGEINLVWDPVSDSNGGSMAAQSVIIRRSAGEGTPPVPGCAGGDGSVDLSTVGTVSINYALRSVTDNGLIDSYPTRYYYRVCAQDAQGNISDGVGTYANAKVQSICNLPPTVSLTGDDLLSTSQLIKSTNTVPFKLLISNGDIGTCPDVNFTLSLVNELNPQDFDKTVGATPETAVGFPAIVTLGTGGAGAPTGKTLNVYITGQPQASQLELYKFAVQVASPGDNHGAPKTTVQVTGMLNDMPPIVHNSNNMGKFQYGSWGQTYTCATCHSNSTTNIKGVYEVISTPIGRRNVVFTLTSSTEATSTGVYGNDLRAVKNVSTNVCEVCHHNTRQHQYSASKAASNNGDLGVVGPGGDEAYNTDHHNSRDCIACHTHNSAFRSIYGVCGDCHGFKATGYSPVGKNTMVKDLTNALGPNPPNYGAHNRHFKAQISCAACHNNTNHGLNPTAWQGDNRLEMGFVINDLTFPGFNANKPVTGGIFYGTDNLNQPFAWYSGSGTKIIRVSDYNASCTTYCHGSWSGNNAPIWVGEGQTQCGTCHNATDVNPPTTGSHAKHAAGSGAGLGITCNRCHGTYSNYSTSNAHINGNVEWKMAEFPGATYKGVNAGSTGELAPSNPLSYGTCSTLYCHSDVQGATGNGTGGPTSYASPVWGDLNTAKCGSCHGCNASDPLTCTTQITSGSHTNHENAEFAFDCHLCHQNGGTTSPLNHANGTINFNFNGLAQNTVYSRGNAVTPGTQFGTCSTSDCHGRFTRQWGTTSTGLTLCEKCHGSATSTGGFYSTRGPGSTMSIYSAGVGVHDIHIQNPNSPRKATFNRFTSYAVGYACSQCHSVPSGPFTAGHIDTPLPAEIPFSNKSSIAKAGSASYRTFSTATYDSGTQSCSAVWCHGGGMDSNSGRGNYAGVAPAITRTNPQWNAPYLTGNGNADCTKCHALPPPAPDASYTHYNLTLNTCASCHQHIGADGLSIKGKSLHVNGVIDGGCNGCHGTPPINNIVGDKDGLATPAQNALNGGAGAHNAHQLLPAIGTNCNNCHDSYNRTMPSNELEIGFNMFNGVAQTGTFTGYTNSVNGPKWKNSNGGTTIVKSNVKAAVCSNLYCHGGGTTGINPIGGAAVTAFNWETTGITCGDCHGTGNTNSTVPSGGSHIKHASADNGGRGLTCETCHGYVSENGTHVNGQVSWQLDHSNPLIGDGATYNNLSAGSLPGPAPRVNGGDYKTCNNFYCHSNAQTANGTAPANTFSSPKWGDAASVNCGTCHANMATDTSANATGSHVKHANTTTGMGVACGYCHQDAGTGTAKHADGAVYVNFTSYINLNSSATYGATAVPFNKTAGSAAFTTCSNTFCHGTAASPVWGVAGTKCNSCHSASTKVSDVNWSGRHATHYNYTSLPTLYTDTVRDISDATSYRFNCAHCHDDNVAKHSLKPASANSAARVFYGISTAIPASSSKRGTYSYGASANSKTDNGFKFTAGTCNTSYCHSNGRGGAPKVTLLNWTTTPAAAGVNCTFCHDGKSPNATASTLSGKHDKHMNPLNNTGGNSILGTGNGYNCVDCHAQTTGTTNNTVVTNKAKHVNAAVNYSGAKANKGLDTSATKNGECSNVYCHSNGNPNATVFTSMTGSKNWNTSTYTISTCNKCHGKSNAIGYPDYANGGTGAGIATANLHPGHLNGMTDTIACSDCHRRSIDTLVANKFRPYSTMHLSGGANVNFNTANAKIGSKATQSTVGMQVTCSNLNCHGQATPIWGGAKAGSGAAGVRTCTKCHGDAATAYTNYSAPQIAPGYGSTGTDTSMTKASPTDARVGAHQRHLVSNVLSAPVKCGECHVKLTGASDAIAMRSANHWNMSTATLTFAGARATINAVTVSRTAGIFTCSNIYCHNGQSASGTNPAPFWNTTGMVKETGTTVGDCVKCHAMPPQTGTHLANGVKTLGNYSSISKVSSCYACHKNVIASPTNVGNVFSDKTQHVNGAVETTMSCNSCHSYLATDAWTSAYGVEGIGAHKKHITYLLSRNPGVTMDAVNDTFGGATFKVICGVCHTNNVAQHTTATPSNPRNIIFGSASTARAFGSSHVKYNGVSGTSSSVNPKSCSNTDCHYRTSPIWSTY